MLKQKHFDLISMSIWRSGYAKEITVKNKVKKEAGESMRKLIAIDLASSLKNDNPSFNAERFMKACGF